MQITRNKKTVHKNNNYCHTCSTYIIEENNQCKYCNYEKLGQYGRNNLNLISDNINMNNSKEIESNNQLTKQNMNEKDFIDIKSQNELLKKENKLLKKNNELLKEKLNMINEIIHNDNFNIQKNKT